MKFLKSKKFIVLIISVALLVIFFYYGNNSIVTTSITYENAKIPEEFDSFKIVQISDLHNKRFGDGQSRLLEIIEEQNPDIIVVTGDLIDCKHTDIDIAMEFITGAVNIAPVYYVSGNHEYNTPEQYSILKEKLSSAGVTLLENEKTEILCNGVSFNLYGIADHGIYDPDSTLEQFDIDKEEFNVLLSHRPELIETYANYGFDIVFTGHAHGGQIRLPFIGGVIAPNQGLFPKYTEGMHTIGETSEIISRGLGNSIAPLRIFNRPEVVVCTFYTA